MPLSYVIYTNQTTTGPYNITFPYISTAHIKVDKNNSPLTITTDYTLSTSPTPSITLTAALTAGDVLRIYRQTPGRNASPNNLPLVDFTDGSVLTAADLDRNTQQLLYLVQESDDTGSGALGPTTDGANWSAASKQVKNLATPTDSTDATTKQYVDNMALYGVNQPIGQAWDLVGNGTNSYLLTGPVPSAAAPELFIVEVGGALQHPGTNYTIVQSAGNIYLQFTAAVASPTTIRVRNLGVSRGTISGSTITVDGSTLSVDMANNRVGIGTTTPSDTLHVNRASVGTNIRFGVGATFGTIGQDSSNNNVFNASTGHVFQTGSTERMRISSAGLVGIGTNAPAKPLHVKATPSTDIVRMETTANLNAASNPCYSSFFGSNGDSAYIGFGGAASTFDVCNRLYGPLRFFTFGTEMMRITADGNFAIGRTDADVPISLSNNVAPDTSTVFNVTNKIKLYNATNAAYGFGVSSGSLNISANQGTTGEIRFWTGGNDTTPPVNRITIPGGSGGIRFPTTAALSVDANTLDDYREATHIIASGEIVGGTTAGSYNVQTGAQIVYTRIGNRVIFDAFFTIGGVTTAGTGAAKITNVPFNNLQNGGGWFPCYYGNLGTNSYGVYAYWAGSEIQFYQSTGATALTSLAITSFVSSTNIRFSGTIRV
jgi:hypothetical protein